MNELCALPARTLLMRMREGALTPSELTRAYLARAERYGMADELNAIAELDGTALAQAKQLEARKDAHDLPLYGLPILVKDNIDVRGMRTTAGSLALCGNRPAHDAGVIARLRKNGAVILGKTNMTELANYTSEGMPSGYSSMAGQVKNAYDRAIDPSGSSSGSAVAASAGLCAAAIGTDTSFSIVGCATVNGVAGLKPAHGALPLSGIVPIASTLDSPGPLARTFSDALLVYSAMRAKPLLEITKKPLSELRLCVNRFNADVVSARQMALYDALLADLRASGVRVSDCAHAYAEMQRVIMRHEFRRDLEAYLARANTDVKTLDALLALYDGDPARMERYGVTLLRAALPFFGGTDDAEYRQALKARTALHARMLAELAAFDACLMTGPTNIMHFTGLPSLSVPLAMAPDGTPRGLILYGADERKLFAAALAIEAVCPWVKDGQGRMPKL